MDRSKLVVDRVRMIHQGYWLLWLEFDSYPSTI